MVSSAVDRTLPKNELYDSLVRSLDALIGEEPDPLANLANAAALLFESLPDVNWAGFYIKRAEELVLGPFQGKPACVRIPIGRGVCGTAAERQETLVVPDVHEFRGHIACDPASRSEVVVPLLAADGLVGVLDIDSAQTSRFDEEDRRGLERFAGQLVLRVDWSRV